MINLIAAIIITIMATTIKGIYSRPLFHQLNTNQSIELNSTPLI